MDTGGTRATVPEEGLHHPGLAPAVDTERCEACGKLLLAPHFVLTQGDPISEDWSEPVWHVMGC